MISSDFYLQAFSTSINRDPDAGMRISASNLESLFLYNLIYSIKSQGLSQAKCLDGQPNTRRKSVLCPSSPRQEPVLVPGVPWHRGVRELWERSHAAIGLASGSLPPPAGSGEPEPFCDGSGPYQRGPRLREHAGWAQRHPLS